MALFAASSKRIYKRLLGYVKPHWRIFATGIASMIILAATEAGIPALLSRCSTAPSSKRTRCS